MGFNFVTDGKIESLPAESKTTLSVNTPTVVEENLSQEIFTEDEEGKMAIQFLEDNGLYAKFLLYCGIQEQLKNLKLSLAVPTE